jgi:ribosomal protein S12 methylthiotransferase accessory factor
MSSNGLASGNHIIEAISHGICEIVERDANALWRYLPPTLQATTRVDLDSIDDEACAEVLERFARAEIDVCAWETTTDVAIPSYRCQIADREGSGFQPLHPVAGSGCHPRREIALLRALTEAAQGRLVLISGVRDDLSQSLFQAEDALQKAREFEAERRAQGPSRRLEDAPTWDSMSLEGDVCWELDQLARAGIRQVAFVDLTKPEFEIPVVRVVIPGLESICEAPGYVPGARIRRQLERLQ